MEYCHDLFSFEKLEAYQESRKLVKEAYNIIRGLPNYERYDLGSQLRRALISITSNIAEGCGRISYREKIHFLEISYGSLMEAYSQIQLIIDLGYISPEYLNLLQPQFASVARLINALRRSYIDKLHQLKNKYNHFNNNPIN